MYRHAKTVTTERNFQIGQITRPPNLTSPNRLKKVPAKGHSQPKRAFPKDSQIRSEQHQNTHLNGLSKFGARAFLNYQQLPSINTPQNYQNNTQDYAQPNLYQMYPMVYQNVPPIQVLPQNQAQHMMYPQSMCQNQSLPQE